MTEATAGGSTTAALDRPNPYVGPRSLRYGESLYGRSQEINELGDLLVAERIVLLYSPSGAGKTSLVEAGLRPELERRDFLVLPTVRVGHESSGIRAGVNRYRLSTLQSLDEGRHESERLPDADLATIGLGPYLAGWAEAGPGLDPCLVFDQFEELFTLDPTDQEAKAEFLAELGVALRDRGRWALFSMREDYIAQLDPHLSLMPKRFASRYRLDLLGPEAAKAAARLPCAEVGVDFTAEAAARLVEDLRKVRVQRGAVVSEEPGPYVEPVQLQVVCRQLWAMKGGAVSSIDLDDVVALGNVDEALADFYVAQVGAAAAASGVTEREIRDWFDRQLITEQGFRTQVDEGPGTNGRAVLTALEDGHIVRADRRRGTQWYELAHDRLVAPIRATNAEWREAHLNPLQREAQAWEQRSRPPGLLMTGEILASSAAWAAAHDDQLLPVDRDYLEACLAEERRANAERRSARRNRRLAVLASIVGVVAVMGLIAALLAYRSAKDQERRATSAQRAAVAAKTAQEKATAEQQALGASSRWFSAAARASGPVDRSVASLYAYESLAATPGGGEAASLQVRRGLATADHYLQHDPAQIVSAAALDRTGQHLVRGTKDGRVELVDLDTQQRTPLFAYPGFEVAAMAASDLDDRLAIVLWPLSPDNAVQLKLLDMATRTELVADDDAGEYFSRVTLGGSPGLVAAVFQPADGDPSLTIWDAATGQRVAGPKLGAEEGRIGPVAISPDANRMAVITGSTDAQLALQVWQRTGDGWDDIRPQGLAAPYFDGAVAFDPTSNRLAYSTADAATMVVDLVSGRAETLPPLPDIQAATDAVFLPDGRLRTLSRDGFVVTWAPSPPEGWVLSGPTQHVDGGPHGLLSANGTRALQDLGGEVVAADVATEVTLVGAAAATAGTTRGGRSLVTKGGSGGDVVGAGPLPSAFEAATPTSGWRRAPEVPGDRPVALSQDGGTLVWLEPAVGMNIQRGDGTEQVPIPCPLLAEGLARGGAPALASLVASANGAATLAAVGPEGACVWRPATRERRLIPPVTGQSMREVALTATGDVVVLGYDLNGTGVVEVRDALADSTRGVGSFAGPVTAVAAVDGQVAWGVAADGLGNVLVPYAIDSLFAVLPVQAPVVALAFAGTAQDGYVAAATATAVYVYNTFSSVVGQQMPLVGGFDLLRGEGTILDLSFVDGDPTKLVVLASDQSVSSYNPLAEPAAVADSIRQTATDRGLLLTDEKCRELVDQACPTG